MVEFYCHLQFYGSSNFFPQLSETLNTWNLRSDIKTSHDNKKFLMLHLLKEATLLHLTELIMLFAALLYLNSVISPYVPLMLLQMDISG